MVGRKRKDDKGAKKTAKKDKTSIASLEMENTEKEMHLHTNNTNATDPITAEDTVPLHSKKKQSKNSKAVVRRSSRLMSSIRPIHSQVVVPVAEHVDLVDNEEEEEPNVQEVSAMPIMVERSVEENADRVVRSTDEYKPKNGKQVTERLIKCPSASMNYKRLYFDSQKKVDFLMEENLQLVKNLEFCRGKIEAYEKMKDVMASPKDVILINNSGKATERTENLLPQMMVGNCSSLTAVAASDAVDDLKKSVKQRKYSRKEKRAKS
ncbi:unnamed protein product [Fraxinus pennsylvanica]|uniref:Uncharacterized protein n=1 Tax=Fraxinus pennsylvanica TaxID=56036 RepID=A0AAD2EB21_9LAMI|nr:unnamed protein product [Fraxinus pennsylvanica]